VATYAEGQNGRGIAAYIAIESGRRIDHFELAKAPAVDGRVGPLDPGPSVV
jgi:hypothetical protein